MKRMDIINKDRCNRCGKSIVVTDIEKGEVICQRCGYVISEKTVDSGPEWRSLSDRRSRARAGAPNSLSKNYYGLSTMIDSSNHDSLGKPLSTSMKFTLNRLRTWDSRSKIFDNKNRNFRVAVNELQIMKDKLALSDPVAEKAAYIYRKALEKNLLAGRAITALMGAALYAACRDCETPRTLRDIMKVANIKYKDVAKTYRLIVKELDLKMPVANSEQCIPRIASRAGLSEKIKRCAQDIIKKAKQHRITSGKHPMGLAAAALYIACVDNDDKTSQKNIAEAAEVSEVTIRNRLKSLEPVTQI